MTKNKLKRIMFGAEPIFRHTFHEVNLGLLDKLFFISERDNYDLDGRMFNRRMFNEDFSSLFSSNHRRDGSLFKIETNDEGTTRSLLAGVRTAYASRSTDETVCDLIEDIAKSLIWFGDAYYFLHAESERREVRLVSLSTAGMISLFGIPIQWVPKRIERHWDGDDEELPREIRILDRDKVLRFHIPSSTKGMLSAQNRVLEILDNHQFSNNKFLPRATYENPNPKNDFDFQVWNHAQELAMMRATRSTGWSARNYNSSQRSDFFDCYRMIRFRRNQLYLRDDILIQLSCELSRVGKFLNPEFALNIQRADELTSVENLNELELRLAREEVGFDEIIDYCYS